MPARAISARHLSRPLGSSWPSSSGVLPPGDAPASAAALAAFLHYDEQRAAMGNAARLRVGRDFALAPMGDALQRAVDAARDRSRWVA